MKKLLTLLTSLALLLSLSGCIYRVPEGYTRKHHSFEKALAYAQKIDPEATVYEDYTDTEDKYGYIHREWQATIGGMECHVASSPRHVLNEGFGAGEFPRRYYTLDTDYDYLLLKSLIEKHQPDWSMEGDSAADRYSSNDRLHVCTDYTEERELSEAELEIAWQEAHAIYLDYNAYPIRKKPIFTLCAPALFGGGDAAEIKITTIPIHDFREEGKKAFFTDYRERWALLR